MLAKILANRLSKVMDDLVHVDQTGFLTGKGTDVNIRSLFLNLANTHSNSGTRVIASLDAEKALTLEWGALMGRFCRDLGWDHGFSTGWICYTGAPGRGCVL